MSRTMGVKVAGMAAMVVWMMAASVACADGLTTLEKGDWGPWAKPVTLLVNSAGEWKEKMAKLADEGALAVVPGPDAPADVDWSKECVVLVASGDNGYQPELQLTSVGLGNLKLAAGYTGPAENQGGGASPYHLAKLNKRTWLRSMDVVGPDAASALPLVGPDSDVTSPAQLTTWGSLKASYR